MKVSSSLESNLCNRSILFSLAEFLSVVRWRHVVNCIGVTKFCWLLCCSECFGIFLSVQGTLSKDLALELIIDDRRNDRQSIAYVTLLGWISILRLYRCHPFFRMELIRVVLFPWTGSPLERDFSEDSLSRWLGCLSIPIWGNIRKT